LTKNDLIVEEALIQLDKTCPVCFPGGLSPTTFRQWCGPHLLSYAKKVGIEQRIKKRKAEGVYRDLLEEIFRRGADGSNS
jgi:hypothetical protein